MSKQQQITGQQPMKMIGMAIVMSAVLPFGSSLAETSSDEATRLLGSLNDADILKQPEIVREIEAMGETAVPSLREAMATHDDKLRHQAIEILGRIGHDADAAIPDLVEALTDSEAQIRRNAAWALGRVGDEANDAIPALQETAKDIQWDVRADAVWAMGRVVEDNGDMSVVDSELVDVVTEFLKDESHHVRWSAAWSLARFGPSAESSLETLVEALEDYHPKVRASAASALGNIAASHHEDLVSEALTKATHDESALVRTRAEGALEALKSRTVPSM